MKVLKYTFLALVLVGFSSCETPPTTYTKITGLWRCDEYNTTTGLNRTYTVDIYSTKDSTQFLLNNFNYENSEISEANVICQLKGKNITISNQAIVTQTVKSGKGLVSNDFKRIDFDYVIYNGITDMAVKATYSRK